MILETESSSRGVSAHRSMAPPPQLHSLEAGWSHECNSDGESAIIDDGDDADVPLTACAAQILPHRRSKKERRLRVQIKTVCLAVVLVATIAVSVSTSALKRYRGSSAHAASATELRVNTPAAYGGAALFSVHPSDRLSNSTVDPANATECNHFKDHDDPCSFVTHAEACAVDGGFINYLELPFCVLHNEAGGIALLILWLLFLFVALGVTAEDYFCPALSVISDTLRLSHNVAGVTFLAFGNGAPDIFSVYSSINNAENGVQLALGELFGSGMFVTSVVLGAVAFKFPFSVTRRPFLRDVVTYLLAASWCYALLVMGEITTGSAIGFCSLYVVYVIVVIVGRHIYQSRKKKKSADPIKEKQREARQEELHATHQQPHHHPKSIAEACEVTESVTIAAALGKAALLIPHATFPPNSLRTSPQHQSNGTCVTNEHTGQEPAHFAPQPSHDHDSRSTQKGDHESADSDGNESDSDDESAPLMGSTSTANSNEAQIASTHSSLNSAHFPITNTVQIQHAPHRNGADGDGSGPGSDSDSEADEDSGAPLLHRRSEMLVESAWTQFFNGCKPFTGEDWSDASLFGKAYFVFSTPVIMALKLTTPVVDYEEEGQNWVQYLQMLQLLTCPVFFVFATGFGDAMIADNYPVWLLCIMIGGVLALLVWATSRASYPPKYQAVFGFMGFIVAVVWIYIIANEIVNLLQTLGRLFEISDAILGLTVLAWGNSIGDFVSNYTVAKQGYPRMAAGACFGGPALNMLLGIGISCTVATLKRDGKYPMHDQPSHQLKVSGGFLLMSLLSSLVFIPSNKFLASRRFGIYLCALYLAYVIAAVTLEFVG